MAAPTESKNFSALTALDVAPASTDELYIQDVSEAVATNKPKRITFANLTADLATAAQGALADTAVQPGDLDADIFTLSLPASTTISAFGATIIDDADAATARATLGGVITDVVNDTTPQLGGDLDVNAHGLISVSNGNIPITPNGTGKAVITNLEAALPINAQTGTTYAPVLADADKLITLSNASPITCTIPANASVAFPVGTKLNFMQIGAGAATIAITSDILSKQTTLTAVLNGQYAIATAIKIASTQWVLFGDLVFA